MKNNLVNNINSDVSTSVSKLGEKRNINFSFCFLYITLTLFLGNNVISFFHLKLEGDSVLALSHYITLPVLFLAVFSNAKYIKFTKNEKRLIFISLLIMMFQKVFMDKSAGMSFFLNSILEPVFICTLLRLLDDLQRKRLRKLLILFVIIEFCVALYEYLTYSMVFAKDVDSFAFFSGATEMRSYALHGHPLQNAFLVSMVITAILSSHMKQSVRYAVFLSVTYLCFALIQEVLFIFYLLYF